MHNASALRAARYQFAPNTIEVFRNKARARQRRAWIGAALLLAVVAFAAWAGVRP